MFRLFGLLLVGLVLSLSPNTYAKNWNSTAEDETSQEHQLFQKRLGSLSKLTMLSEFSDSSIQFDEEARFITITAEQNKSYGKVVRHIKKNGSGTHSQYHSAVLVALKRTATQECDDNFPYSLSVNATADIGSVEGLGNVLRVSNLPKELFKINRDGRWMSIYVMVKNPVKNSLFSSPELIGFCSSGFDLNRIKNVDTLNWVNEKIGEHRTGYWANLSASELCLHEDTESGAREEIRLRGIKSCVQEFTTSALCTFATQGGNWSNWPKRRKHVQEAKRRGLSCGVGEASATQTASVNTGQTVSTSTRPNHLNPDHPEYYADMTDDYLCKTATGYPDHAPEGVYGNAWSSHNPKYVQEAKRRGLTCGVGETSTTQIASSTTTQSNTPTSAELLAARRKAEELEQQLAALKAEQEQQQQTISNDTKLPTITIASASTTGAQGIIRGRVNDNTGIAELRIDGQKTAVDSNGNFSATTYVPEGGTSVNIEAIDLAGLSSTMSVRVDRATTQTASIDVLAVLDGSAKNGTSSTTQNASESKAKPKPDPVSANTATTTQSNSLTSIAMTTGSIEPWMSSTSERFEDRIIRNWCAPPNETTLGGEPFLDPNSSTWNRCAVNNGPKPSPISYETVKRFYTKSENRKLLCRRVKKYKSYEETLSLLKSGASKSALTYFILARDVELDCSKKEAVHSDVLSANAIEQLDSERQKRFKLEQQLAALKAQQEQQKQTISSDTSLPTITIASVSSNGPQGTVKGRVSDNTGIAEVRVDGKQIQTDRDGNFTANTYVPEGGVSVSIQAFNLAGLSSSMSVRLDRSASTSTTSISFDSLNPLGRRVAKNNDALALIIGVDGYENTPARAMYADSDAKVFADYASQKLGIPTNRIKTLVNDGAGERELLLSVKSWLSRSVKQNQSDVYIFFAGHGLASDDGSKMYLLPYDGAPELLDDTAILRDRLFSDVAAANPRSVTVFLDTCYSGTTRGTDMLIASRPIAIRALEQSIPDNFTVMTAAAGDQTAKPLIEAKHGMFSYFLMKGMEGEADANNDNEITAGELHSYVQTNVIQQSSGSQTPELQGDADRVLVRFQ